MTLPSSLKNLALKDLVPRLWGKREVPATGTPATTEAEPFRLLHREIERAFANFWQMAEPAGFGSGFGGLPASGLQARADVVDTGKAIEVTVELPGLEEKEVEVSVVDGLLTVRAEKKSEREDRRTDWHLAERRYGLIQRSLMLPPGADPDRAEACFRNGVLTVTVPKTAAAAAEVHRIVVRQG